MAGKAKALDPLKEISARMVATLEAHRAEQPDSVVTTFLTWKDLVGRQAGVSQEWATAALRKPPAKSQIIIALAGDEESPVCLADDRQQLVRSSELLQKLLQHPHSGCSESQPIRPLSEILKPLTDRNVRREAETWWTEHSTELPAGIEAVRGRGGKLSVYDQRFPRPELALCRRLIHSLRELRQSGEQHFPAEASAVLAHAGVSEKDRLLKGALAEPEFQKSVTAIRGSLVNGWLVLRNELDACLRSDSLMRRLLQDCCSETITEIRLSQLARKLNKDFQKQLIEIWRTHLDLQHKFAFVDLAAAGTRTRPDVLLSDLRFPRPEKRLSEKLIAVLEKLRSQNHAAYPVTWKQLVQFAESQNAGDLLQKATAIEPFQSRVLWSVPGNPDAPLVLISDGPRLAESAQLLSCLLAQLVKEPHQAVPVDKLVSVRGLHPLLKPHLSAAIERFTSDGKFPNGSGGLRVGSRWVVFRLQDIAGGAPAEQPKSKSAARAPAPAPAPAPLRSSEVAVDKPLAARAVAALPVKSDAVSGSSGGTPATDLSAATPVDQPGAADFAAAFELVFERLSEQSRLPGCVSLADLRPAMPGWSRQAFDQGIIQLRRAGRYSLSVVEGRYPLTDEEREACLVINNVPHLLVRRSVH